MAKIRFAATVCCVALALTLPAQNITGTLTGVVEDQSGALVANASVVAVNDITSWMQTTGSATFRYLETFVVAGLVYVAMCQLINVGRIATGRLLFRRTS